MFRKIVFFMLCVCLAQAADKPQYVFVWAGDDAKKSEDFLAVIDADPKSKTYGQTVVTVSVPGPTGTPHHTELVMPANGHLLANQHDSGKTAVFDVRDPLHPKLLHTYGDLAGFAHPHTYIRDGKQNVLATFQYRGAPHQAGHKMHAEPGGLVSFTEAGKVLASGSAADPSAKDELIRPYSVVALPKIGRAVTTNTSMHFKDEGTSRTIQIWRLRDLKLLQTIVLPSTGSGKGSELPGEPVLAADGKSVLIHTFSCGLYEVKNIDTKPVVRPLRTFDAEFCGVPLRIGRYWVGTLFDKHAVAVYDLNTPDVKEVSRVTLDDKQRPHWLSADATGKRIVLNSGEYGEHRLYLLDFDATTGALKVDENFRDAGSSSAGVSMDGKKWGDAYPHGAVFSR
jgi:WD40 repeat protein